MAKMEKVKFLSKINASKNLETPEILMNYQTGESGYVEEGYRGIPDVAIDDPSRVIINHITPGAINNIITLFNDVREQEGIYLKALTSYEMSSLDIHENTSPMGVILESEKLYIELREDSDTVYLNISFGDSSIEIPLNSLTVESMFPSDFNIEETLGISRFHGKNIYNRLNFVDSSFLDMGVKVYLVEIDSSGNIVEGSESGWLDAIAIQAFECSVEYPSTIENYTSNLKIKNGNLNIDGKDILSYSTESYEITSNQEAQFVVFDNGVLKTISVEVGGTY